MRPHPPHSGAQHPFAALRLIGAALAVRVRLGDPRVVPRFRWSFLLDMPPSTSSGSPSAADAQFLHRRRWPSSHSDRFGTPKWPIIRFRWVILFRGFLVRYMPYGTSLRPAELFAPLCESDRTPAQPTRAFTPELSTIRSPASSSGIATVATEQVLPVGLSPTGTPASVAAPE